MTLLAVVVRDAGNQAPGVVLQLLARSAHGHNPPLIPGQVVLILHTAAHAIQALEQPAIGVVGIALWSTWPSGLSTVSPRPWAS